MVDVMASTAYRTVVASFGAVALVLSVNAASAEAGAGNRGAIASAPSIVSPTTHPFAARPLRHRHRNNVGTFWPAFADTRYETNGRPALEYTPQTSADIHYTYTYDVPWDWAHRYPPNVVPSDRPYTPSCSDEAVTVPGGGGRDHTVNITRCY